MAHLTEADVERRESGASDGDVDLARKQRPNASLDDWSQVPKGLCLVRMFHEGIGKHCLHLHLKLDGGPWYEQPRVPAALSQEATKETHREFWAWAEKSLPIYNYPGVVASFCGVSFAAMSG